MPVLMILLVVGHFHTTGNRATAQPVVRTEVSTATLPQPDLHHDGVWWKQMAALEAQSELTESPHELATELDYALGLAYAPMSDAFRAASEGRCEEALVGCQACIARCRYRTRSFFTAR